MKFHCKRCGYLLSAPTTAKEDCVWCNSSEDTLVQLSPGDLVKLNNRYDKLTRQQQVNYIIALGLEGFTINEISAITNTSNKHVSVILHHAEVYKVKQ